MREKMPLDVLVTLLMIIGGLCFAGFLVLVMAGIVGAWFVL